jgi:hypothetical protein
MVLFQVGISSLLILTRIAYFSYSVITTNAQKTNDQIAWDTFFSQLTTELFYLNYAKSFYVYTLFSKYFRKIFMERIRKIYAGLNSDRTTDVSRRQRNLPGQRNRSLRPVQMHETTKNL